MFGARFDDAGSRRSFVLADPLREITVYKIDEVADAIRSVAKEAAAGNWVAGYVAFDAAPGFDDALVVRDGYDSPLVWFGVFGDAVDVDPPRVTPTTARGYSVSRWVPAYDRTQYGSAFAAVRRHIELGDSYQVNLTFPLHAEFTGDPEMMYANLVASRQGKYAAHLWHDDIHVLSVSPERFFSVKGGRVTTRPMKGTASRGRWTIEDDAKRLELTTSDKNRAENLMIVDLIRNDLGRIAEFGTVTVDELFTVERYRTVWQMVSEISATIAPHVELSDVFAALFPCGSVTGAPKARTMEIIAEQEPTPRGIYCGAVGFVPPGDGLDGASFNVAIRTTVLNEAAGVATYGVGGGVTWDSHPGEEYEEALTKARLLTESAADVELLETIRWDDGYVLLEQHIERLGRSAAYWGTTLDLDSVRRTLFDLEASIDGPTRVRLVVSEGGEVSVTFSDAPELFPTGPGLAASPVRVRIDLDPLDSRDPRLFHKLADRSHFDDRHTRHPDADDVLCVNEHGHITESTIANVVFLIDGEWVTPVLSDGLLPGILRDELLKSLTIKERHVTIAEAREAEAVALINSVRGWRPAAIF